MLLHGLRVHTRSSVLYFNARLMSVPQITHIYNLCVRCIPAIAWTIPVAFLDCILTSGLNT